MDDAIKGIVDRFGLVPHPEGGYFREVYRASAEIVHPGVPANHQATRSTGTLIYYLLAAAQFSAFHRIKWSDEIWHLYAGGPLELHTIDSSGHYSQRQLTADPALGEPTAMVAAGVWQAARLGPDTRWAFCGCSVAPGFEYTDFEMLPGTQLARHYPQHSAIIRTLSRQSVDLRADAK